MEINLPTKFDVLHNQLEKKPNGEEIFLKAPRPLAIKPINPEDSLKKEMKAEVKDEIKTNPKETKTEIKKTFSYDHPLLKHLNDLMSDHPSLSWLKYNLTDKDDPMSEERFKEYLEKSVSAAIITENEMREMLELFNAPVSLNDDKLIS